MKEKQTSLYSMDCRVWATQGSCRTASSTRLCTDRDADLAKPLPARDNVHKFYRDIILLYPNLTASQKVLLVPGAFGSHVNHYPNGTYVCDNHCYDEMCAKDAIDFYRWAQSDPMVVAITPWNWGGCPSCNGSRWTPPHTCCMNEVGARDQPLTRAAWFKIGDEIKKQQKRASALRSV